jgi:hypothetical protein
MMRNKKFKLVLGVCFFSAILFSCGDPAENMNKTMADFSDKCISEEYDCKCWESKVKEHFKTDEAYMKYWENHSAMPDELIDKLGDCSLDEDFDF